MALNVLKCNHLTLLGLKGLTAAAAAAVLTNSTKIKLPPTPV